MSDRVEAIEEGTAHGYASVTVPGHAQKRYADRMRQGQIPVAAKPNLDEWHRLARDFPGHATDEPGPVN